MTTPSTTIPEKANFWPCDLQWEFGQLGFRWRGGTSVNGMKRVIGSPYDNTATLELIGTRNNERIITLLIANVPAYRERNSLVVQILLGLLFPDWPERQAWFVKGLQALATSPEPIRVERERATLLLSYHAVTDMITLAIHSKKPKRKRSKRPVEVEVVNV